MKLTCWHHAHTLDKKATVCTHVTLRRTSRSYAAATPQARHKDTAATLQACLMPATVPLQPFMKLAWARWRHRACRGESAPFWSGRIFLVHVSCIYMYGTGRNRLYPPCVFEQYCIYWYQIMVLLYLEQPSVTGRPGHSMYVLVYTF